MKTNLKNRYYVVAALACFGIGQQWLNLTLKEVMASILMYIIVRCVMHVALKVESSVEQRKANTAAVTAVSAHTVDHHPFI